MQIEINGYAIELCGYSEICQGGPEACDLLVDRRPIEGRFDPSPLAYSGNMLIPKRKISLLKSGYVLTMIDLRSLKETRLSKVMPYMKLIKVQDGIVEYATTARSSETARLSLY
ncbi:hypothetical protein [Sphingobium ummariense]